jgi:hypothetical protein
MENPLAKILKDAAQANVISITHPAAGRTAGVPPPHPTQAPLHRGS